MGKNGHRVGAVHAAPPNRAVARRWHIALVAAIVVLAVGLTLPSLEVGWVGDDIYHRWLLTGGGVNDPYGPARPGDGGMFRFFDGDAARSRELKRIGVLPWWTYDQARVQFWRPVTAATHVLDYRAWPERPRWMHAHSVAWYALLVAAAALLYRRMMGATLAALLATLMFAIDDAHALPVGWLASRNALIAGVFGILTIVAHRAARRRRDAMMPRLGFPLLAAALLGASLFSAEAGVATLGYLVAYALVVERGRPLRTRVLSLVPYAIVIIAWRIAWWRGGYGVHAVEDLYVDPIATPLAFTRELLTRLPALMLAQFAYPPADVSIVLNQVGKIALALMAVIVLAPLALVMRPLLRRSRVARFWMCGMLLSAIPLCAALASNRQLLFIGIGAFGLLGQFLSMARHRRYWAGLTRRRRLGRYGIVAAMVIVHLVVAPIVLFMFSRWPVGPPEFWRAFGEIPDLTSADATRDVVIVAHPMPMHVFHTMIARVSDGQPLPRNVVVLAPSTASMVVTRADERTLIVRAAEGYFPDMISRLGYSPKHPPRVGETIELPAVRITVLELTDDGRPREVRFEFAATLEDASLHWLWWRGGGWQRFKPPPVGRDVTYEGRRFPF